MSAFITVEGTDGSGKTTLINGLKKKLNGKNVLFTREPGGTDLGNAIRNVLLDDVDIDPLSEVYLFAAARRQHVRNVIIPALNSGVSVISDRFLDSSVAYQGAGRQVGEETVKNINAQAVQGVIPDITVFLDVSPKEGLRRIHTNRTDEINRLDNEELEFYERVKISYEKMIRDNPERYLVVDAELNPSEIVDIVVKQLSSIL
jgi:thymidylate kinase